MAQAANRQHRAFGERPLRGTDPEHHPVNQAKLDCGHTPTRRATIVRENKMRYHMSEARILAEFRSHWPIILFRVGATILLITGLYLANHSEKITLGSIIAGLGAAGFA